MYRKLRIKIALSSIAVLLLLFLGTICIVYISSYRETMRADQDMLRRYAEAYRENGNPEGTEAPPPPMQPGDLPPDSRPVASQFYSVELDASGTAVSINNPDRQKITDGELTELAGELARSGRDSGMREEWVYFVDRLEGSALIALLDNSLVSAGSSTLFGNTLRYGGAMIVVLCALVWFMSGVLVKPLEKNEREQRRFLSDAGHELKTPVSVIATNAELLQREIGENRWLDNIIAENGRSGELVRNLLTLTRYQEEETPRERLNLSEIAEGVILPFEGVAFEKGHALKAEIRPEVYIQGNEQQLSSLLSILLDNAVQYSSEGAEIEISLEEENRRVMLRVRNQSPQMSREECRRLFDRFYRTDSSRPGNGHYGLGLSIAQRIVQAHRGEISASWRDGAMTFRILFPAA